MIITDELLVRNLGLTSSEVYSDEVNELRKILEFELNQSEKNGFPGIGLSCPQIGIAKKMAIVRIPGRKYISIDLVNPIIIEKYDLHIFNGEGCLSFPGLFGKTQRFKEIKVKNQIEPMKFIATGLPAICIQHEIDHINGVVLPDLIIK